MNNENKYYGLIVASISEEVNYHIVSIIVSYGALMKIKDIYDSH